MHDILDSQKNLGRGQRKSRKTINSISSDDENEIPAPMPTRKQTTKASQNKSEKSMLSILKEKRQAAASQVKNVDARKTDDNPTIIALQREVSTLKTVTKDLQETNAALISAIEKLSFLPSAVERMNGMLESLKIPASRVREPSSTPVRHRLPSTPRQPAMDSPVVTRHTGEDEAANLVSEENAELTTFKIPTHVVERAHRSDARKMVNDLMHGLYSDDFLASHSVTGGPAGSSAKPGMEVDKVRSIISTVCHHFPDKTATDIRHFMREKLNNAAKTIRRRQKKD